MEEHVEVVIKIPKYYLTRPQDYTCLAECVRRGIILPKGHKRLIEDNFNVGPVFDKEGNRVGYQYVTQEDLKNALTIVDADKEGAE